MKSKKAISIKTRAKKAVEMFLPTLGYLTRAGTVEGQTLSSNLSFDQTTRPDANGSGEDSRHQAASRFRTDAQSCRNFFR